MGRLGAAHQQELHNSLTCLLHQRRVCLYLHAGSHWHRARCNRLWGFLHLQKCDARENAGWTLLSPNRPTKLEGAGGVTNLH